MNKLNTTSRTTEVNAAAIRMIELYEKQKNLSTDTFLKSLFDTLKAQSERMTIAIRRSRALSVLEDKDNVRDAQIRAMHYLILGYLYSPVVEVKTAAQKVSAVFGKYGLQMINANYASETSLVESLLKDFEVAETKTAIAALAGLQQIIDELRTAQSAFVTARVEYEKEQSQAGVSESASNIKLELLDSINAKLVVYLNAMVIVDNATYAEFGNALGQIITTNNDTVARRTAKADKSAQEETTTDTTTKA